MFFLPLTGGAVKGFEISFQSFIDILIIKKAPSESAWGLLFVRVYT